MKKEKGITLIVLTVTVIVMLIILGVAVASGGDSAETVQLQAFISDCEIIQSKVDVINEKLKLNLDYLETIGIGSNVVENWENDTIKEKLNILNLTQELKATINFKEGTVYIETENDTIKNSYYWENGKIQEKT